MKTFNYNPIRLLLFTGLVLGASALSGQEDYLSEDDFFEENLAGTIEVSDPLEPLNRVIYHFNDFVYLNVLSPVSDAYQYVTPDPVETAASNFFRNLRYPIRLLGNLLQGRFTGARIETERFLINTTIGIGGLFTPADKVEALAPIPPEGVGQAFGSWGIPEGPYLVLPILGPSNLRDTVGLFVDSAAHVTSEPYSLIDDWNWEWRAGLNASEIIAGSPVLLKAYKSMKGSSIDPYSSLKSAHTQRRRAQVEQ